MLRLAAQPAARRAASVWAGRAQAEAQASARFVQLAALLATVDAPAVVIDLAQQAAREEAEHVTLCVDLCTQLGGAVTAPEIPVLPVSQGGDRETETLLRVVGMCCINETVSAAVLRQMLHNTDPGPIRETVRRILRDEIGHSRIGWAYLAHVAQTGDVSAAGQALPHLLDAAVTDELFDAGAADPDLDSAHLGSVPRTQRLALFEAAVTELVFPGLAQFGVDARAGRAWLSRCTPPKA